MPTASKTKKPMQPSTLTTPKKARRGFAAMSPTKQREIATKGGQTISKNRKHMRKIGKIGGANSHRGDRQAA